MLRNNTIASYYGGRIMGLVPVADLVTFWRLTKEFISGQPARKWQILTDQQALPVRDFIRQCKWSKSGTSNKLCNNWIHHSPTITSHSTIDIEELKLNSIAFLSRQIIAMAVWYLPKDLLWQEVAFCTKRCSWWYCWETLSSINNFKSSLRTSNRVANKGKS